VVATPPLSCQAEVDKISAKLNATGTGAPKGSTTIQCTGSQVVAYGNPRVIRYTRPTSSAENIAQGKILFEQNCSSCHSADATGSTKAPALRGVVGPGTVEFWVDTGRMPATNLLKVQAQRRPPRLNPQEASQVAAFINSLTPRAPYVPTVTLRHANLTTGASLFALNCAACHTITGFGDELGFSTNAPTLRDATPAQIAEAIRSGPGNMPIFAGNLSDGQVRDIVAYVSKYIQHPDDPGGAGLGGVGPVGEGFVALLFGAGGLMLVCFWIGERS
jgi:ubiquinol-cytochrome c reductase cytochrome c subunit